MNFLETGPSLFVLGCLAIAGCGGATTPEPVGAPPAKPDAPATLSVERQTFAVGTLFLGDGPADGSGTQSITAWKKFGFNLDGKVSTRNSTDVCVPHGGPKWVHDNGDDGIDNSFGANLIPLLLDSYGAEAPNKVNAAIANGSPTLILETTGLSDATQQTNTGLTAQLFDSSRADTGAGTLLPDTRRAIDPASLVDGLSLESGAKTHFGDAYIVGGTWVSGGGAHDVVLPLTIGPNQIELVIHHAVITFARRVPGAAVTGALAGVLDREEMVAATASLTAFAGCESMASVSDLIRQSADILSDGTNVGGVDCTGISIGIGFIAEPVDAAVRVGTHVPRSDDPCAPARPM